MEDAVLMCKGSATAARRYDAMQLQLDGGSDAAVQQRCRVPDRGGEAKREKMVHEVMGAK